ncbi:MAG: Asp-tRNA(Asn)/Glu-tRNA(Gln) amidotransferase subunit GatC [Firmicutes bacterium]|nr:Asp-tRNA(Asn)/Glu-tRNA(Gln) amidotransferase subunit GatC [Bacillota bacterium]
MAVNQEITESELDELGELASLCLDSAEKKELARQLNAVMGALSRIREVETAGIEPAVHPAVMPVRFRDDEVEPSLSQEQVFSNTAHRSDSYFRVPRIAGEESGEG